MQSQEAQPRACGIDKDGFAQAYAHGYRATVNFLRSRGISEDRAREYSQAAWGKGWERRQQLRDSEQIVAWVNTIAFNLFRNDCRKPCEMEPFAREAPSKDGYEDAADVRRLLSLCSPQDRDVLRRFYFEGFDSNEIACLTGVSAGAVRIRLMRARQRLRKAVDSRGNVPCSVFSNIVGGN